MLLEIQTCHLPDNLFLVHGMGLPQCEVGEVFAEAHQHCHARARVRSREVPESIAQPPGVGYLMPVQKALLQETAVCYCHHSFVIRGWYTLYPSIFRNLYIEYKYIVHKITKKL